MEEKLVEIILKYGQKKTSFAEVQCSIKEVSNRNISKFMVDEYWGYVEIEDIINDLLNLEIVDWEQFEIEKQIEFYIKKYEAEVFSLEDTQLKIQELTGKKVSQYTLDNYWKSEDLEELVKVIATREIQDWENIDDKRALALIAEIIENVSESAIIKRNAAALEKKYTKASGTVTDLIFWNELTPIEILKELGYQSKVGRVRK